MKKTLLASLWLVLLSQAACSDENRQARSSDVSPEATGSLTIIFEGSAKPGFSDDEKQLITDLVMDAEREVRALLPTLPDAIEVTAMVIDRNVDIVGGVTGRADAPGKVLVEFSNVFPGGISAAAKSALSSTIFHEFHHLARGWTIQGNKFGPGIPIAAVNEGLATVFAEEYTGVYFEEAYKYPEDAAAWLQEILALPVDADYSTWMMGEHPDGRNSIGYRVGRYIVHQATVNSGKSVLELSELAPNEILKLAESPTAKCTIGCSEPPETYAERDPFGRGPYPVASTNMEIDPAHVDIGDDVMHEYLTGRSADSGQSRFVADILRYPEAAWVTDVKVPDIEELYGPASGMTLPAVAFIAYPSSEESPQRSYSFPYHDAAYGRFENMLGPGEEPRFADPDRRYPLIILSHGSNAHGIYDVAHAHDLASHGYIVAVITYGDDRTAKADGTDLHVGYLRPLITKAVLDALLDSSSFGPHIDADNIGISGFSFGGFTALAMAGGPIEGNSSSVSDRRIKAAVVAAPWVGGIYGDENYFAFGLNNVGLNRIDIPVIALFGTNDEVTHSSFLLPAMKELAGPVYLIELMGQTHAFEDGSWEDRNNWELLFFSAYLKRDPASLEALNTTWSMNGGNEDIQLFDYQVSGSNL